MRVIVSHPEHDSIYVNDLACRSFGRETLRSLCNLMLENLPAGAPCPTPPYLLRHRPLAFLPFDPACGLGRACCVQADSRLLE